MSELTIAPASVWICSRHAQRDCRLCVEFYKGRILERMPPAREWPEVGQRKVLEAFESQLAAVTLERDQLKADLEEERHNLSEAQTDLGITAQALFLVRTTLSSLQKDIRRAWGVSRGEISGKPRKAKR